MEDFQSQASGPTSLLSTHFKVTYRRHIATSFPNSSHGSLEKMVKVEKNNNKKKKNTKKGLIKSKS